MTSLNEIAIVPTGIDVLIYFEGRLIAKRGKPGTKWARRWKPLAPGFKVEDGEEFPDGSQEIFVIRDGVRMH